MGICTGTVEQPMPLLVHNTLLHMNPSPITFRRVCGCANVWHGTNLHIAVVGLPRRVDLAVPVQHATPAGTIQPINLQVFPQCAQTRVYSVVGERDGDMEAIYCT